MISPCIKTLFFPCNRQPRLVIFPLKLLVLFPFPSRLGRHGKVFLTIPSQSSTDEQKFIQKGEAPGTDSLFDLDPEAMVFYVGGFPTGFRVTAVSFKYNVTYMDILDFSSVSFISFFVNFSFCGHQLPPPLSLAPFVGCIELGSLNNDIISLYNFREINNMDVGVSTPCPRWAGLSCLNIKISQHLLVIQSLRITTFNCVIVLEIGIVPSRLADFFSSFFLQVQAGVFSEPHRQLPV